MTALFFQSCPVMAAPALGKKPLRGGFGSAILVDTVTIYLMCLFLSGLWLRTGTAPWSWPSSSSGTNDVIFKVQSIRKGFQPWHQFTPTFCCFSYFISSGERCLTFSSIGVINKNFVLALVVRYHFKKKYGVSDCRLASWTPLSFTPKIEQLTVQSSVCTVVLSVQSSCLYSHLVCTVVLSV